MLLELKRVFGFGFTSLVSPSFDQLCNAHRCLRSVSVVVSSLVVVNVQLLFVPLAPRIALCLIHNFLFVCHPPPAASHADLILFPQFFLLGLWTLDFPFFPLLLPLEMCSCSLSVFPVLPDVFPFLSPPATRYRKINTLQHVASEGA